MERRICLEGCLNFRDLGGYPTADGRLVRWRHLFRSDALHGLTAADVAVLRDQLGVGDVIDLRSTMELDTEGRGVLAAEPLRFHHVPLFDGDTGQGRERAAEITLADRYVLLAELAREPIARVLRILADADRPAIYHCAAGKDRTGVISAILLGVLGVPDPVIVADYAATQETLDAIVDRLMSLEGYRTMLEHLPPDTLHAAPETMVDFLRRVAERHGSMEGYARAIGVAGDTLVRLRDRLLVAP
jgi:protein-tyrosine phosphatase